MSDRKYYRTFIIVDVLSDEPIPEYATLEGIATMLDGDYSGAVHIAESQEVSREEMHNLLISQHSDPDFFDYPDTVADPGPNNPPE